MTTTHRKPTQLESLAAGVIAGAVEGAVTYPAEFLKTKAQFASSKGQPVRFFVTMRPSRSTGHK